MCDRCADEFARPTNRNAITSYAPPIAPEPELAADWLDGAPMNPEAVSPEPVPSLPGFPFAPTGGAAVVIVGPSGGGRSSLMQAGLFDAACNGLRSLYLGHEVSLQEFNARAAFLCRARGVEVTDDLLTLLSGVRYVPLADAIARAYADPQVWAVGLTGYDIMVVDPTSAVESALGLDFERRNTDYIQFFDRLIKPAVDKGVTCFLVDNVGHGEDAKRRAKGASAKRDRADVALSCAAVPEGLSIRADKVRSVRAPFATGDQWIFRKDTQTIESLGATQDHEDRTDFRPTQLMERVSAYLDEDPGANVNKVKEKVPGKAEYVAKALAKLVQEGYVEARQDGQKRSHHNVRPFTEQGDKPGPDSRDSVTDTQLELPTSTESRETPVDPGPGTGSQPSPWPAREPAASTESPRSRYVVRDSRESVEAGPGESEATTASEAWPTPVLVAVADPDETRTASPDCGQPDEMTEADWLETFGVAYEDTPVLECSYPEPHRRLGVDWIAPGGRVVCGRCHPQPKAVAA